MKQILIILSALLCINASTLAQDIPNGPDCRIWYDYDAAGQRVKRYYRCIEEHEHQTDAKIRVTLFPNPTDGPVIVVTDPSVDELAVNIFTIDGSFIASTSCQDCNYTTLNIAGQLVGSYLVQVTATKQGYPNWNEGYVIIKND